MKRGGLVSLAGFGLATLVVSPATVTLAEAAPESPMIDPEVRTLANAGPVRVLVQLRVNAKGESAPPPEAIASAQDLVLARLPQTAVVRRYATVPLLALEIDGQALRLLETMSDVVLSVTPDRKVPPQ